MSEETLEPEYRLVSFHRRRPALKEVEHLSILHAALLPRSPVVLLGRHFMNDFYYQLLPSAGHIAGAIAYLGAEPIGFITVAPDPAGFMRSAFRRHWLRICWLVSVSIVRSPRRLAAVREALDVNRGLTDAEHSEDTGELLSFGVLPEYRRGSFVRHSGFRIADDLLRIGLELLRETGASRVRAVVDADNIEAGLFYRGRGWTPSGVEARGWSESTLEYTLDLEHPEGG